MSEYVELSRDNKPGDKVTWRTLAGTYRRGILKDWDNNTAIVSLEDGREVAVDASRRMVP